MTDAIAGDLFASFRTPAWHRKGKVFENEILSASGMLDEIPELRDREVTLEPVHIMSGPDQESLMPVEVPGHYVSVSNWADRAPSFYGTVGSRYGVIQDLDAFSVFDGFRAETMGALYDGRKTFATFALDRETVLDPNGVADVVKVYGLAVNSHDGTSPLTWQTTPTRVVCANTLAVAMGNRSHVTKVRHTKSSAERVSEHAAIYRDSLAYMDEFDRIASELFSAKFSDKQFENVFNTLFPKPDIAKGPASETKWENKRGLNWQAWNGEPNAGIKGTAWGAWNALTEANQWGRNEREGTQGEDAFVAAGMGLDHPTNRFRSDTLSLVMARAGVK